MNPTDLNPNESSEYATFTIRINKKKLAIATSALAVVGAGAAAFVFARKNPELLADVVPVETDES